VALAILAFARRDLEQAGGWLGSSVLVRLGQWSFALYMVHELLLRAAHPLMVEHRWTAVLFIVLSIGAAGALFEWFERPIEQRLRGRARPAVQLETARR
jgi:peptidoglycan/LPS O-acetylase OafA/YrhL